MTPRPVDFANKANKLFVFGLFQNQRGILRECDVKSGIVERTSKMLR